ncbi:MAG: hypothetical protein HKO53_15190 [Gemmatimonadetes bacterium]|nr:hypothetical protein [Gemmatimonadota bacterium]
MNIATLGRRCIRASLTLCALALLWQTPAAQAQTDAAMIESEDTHYYDFWPGTWVEVIDGRADTLATTFTVRRSVHPAAYEESWRQVYDGGSYQSTALRAWDQVAGRWMFTWVSDNALFQVWEGQKIGEDWYIVKEFEIDGAVILSRQAWIPEGEHRLTRILERSTDGGHTWTTRYRGTFVRVSK